jgi:ankyrin repeat protein
MYKKYCKAGNLLLEKGCELLDRNDKGETPLHSAALAGRVLAIKWLITKCRVDINITTKTGETSLHLATQARRKSAIKELLRYGVNPALRGPNGTALDIAKLLRETELVDILEEWAAHPELYSTSPDDAADPDGYACIVVVTAILEILLTSRCVLRVAYGVLCAVSSSGNTVGR